MLTMIYGLSKGEGFVVVTGAVGAGKTTLIERLLVSDHIADAITAPINTTQLGSENLLQLIAYNLDLPRVAETKAGVLRDLRDYLFRVRDQGKRVLLIVDEVQNLSQEALEEMRMLSNFQDEANALLQILLVGQPEFRERLGGPECEQIRQRVVASYHLRPLAPADIRHYVEHRLRASGWAGSNLFSDRALTRIAEASGGVPRRINRLCDRCLLYGYLEDRIYLDLGDIDAVVEEMRNESLEAAPSTDPMVDLRHRPADPPTDERDSGAAVNGHVPNTHAADDQGGQSISNATHSRPNGGGNSYADLEQTVANLQREVAGYKSKLNRIVSLVAREQRRLRLGEDDARDGGP
jgi:type II secretory pathway predicted ATPase ExeA